MSKPIIKKYWKSSIVIAIIVIAGLLSVFAKASQGECVRQTRIDMGRKALMTPPPDFTSDESFQRAADMLRQQIRTLPGMPPDQTTNSGKLSDEE
ncbi:MAG: hypothetical protein IKN25_06030 [Spirochaetales bacterium]|nr:hypothetical protein [Spirochaetales bacterium]